MVVRATSVNRANAAYRQAIHNLSQVNLARASLPNQYHEVVREQRRKLKRVNAARRLLNAAINKHANSLQAELRRAQGNANKEAQLVSAINMRHAALARRASPRSPNVARRFGNKLRAWRQYTMRPPNRGGVGYQRIAARTAVGHKRTRNVGTSPRRSPSPKRRNMGTSP